MNIYLAAARTDPSLTALVEEVRNIEEIFRPLKEKKLEVISQRVADTEDLFTIFNWHGQDIGIFHYSGHSNQQELDFPSGGHIEGIAGLFNQNQVQEESEVSNPLRLVFINGCCSYGMVKAFHGAGVAVVIASVCEIGDQSARDFATQFYKTWVIEGKKLKEAFESAANFIKSSKTGNKIDISVRGLERLGTNERNILPWGMYPNEQIDPQKVEEVDNWIINPVVHLPYPILQNVRTISSEALLELVDDFERENSVTGSPSQDPLLNLISQLPWPVGVHLRRLFVVDPGKSMSTPGIARLRELVNGYTEITRFLCYTLLSLWCQSEQAINGQRSGENIFPWEARGIRISYIYYLEQFQKLQRGAKDKLGFLEHLDGFFEGLDQNAVDFMEELRGAVEDTQHLESLISSRMNPGEGVPELCLQVEATFTHFLKRILFLCNYRLYTIRSISVDKISYLDTARPFVHKTMLVHAAFSSMELLPTEREVASDNYSMLLGLRDAEHTDPFAEVINLSPFYVDRSSWLEAAKLQGGNLDANPMIFVLSEYLEKDKTYVFKYIERDPNHRYQSEDVQQLIIRKSGAFFPAALQVDIRGSQQFRIIYNQLERLRNGYFSSPQNEEL